MEPYPGKRLIYLDSAASSQKPTAVLDSMDAYYRSSHANVHRGAHALAIKATEQYETARDQVQALIGASSRDEVVFTRGATDSINLVAQSYGATLKSGDEIVLSVMEHHSNLVPWQMAAQRSGAVLRFAQLDDAQALDLAHLQSLLNERTEIVAISYASNVLGTVSPVHEIIRSAHAVGAKVLLDACQALPHMPINVKELDVDFLVASAHKMCGPTGIGLLYGKAELLERMPPIAGGGEMIDTVHLQHSTYAKPPYRFEAGTPPIAEAIGLGAACQYLQDIGMERIAAHQEALGRYLYNALASRSDLTLYGPPPSAEHRRGGLVSFNHQHIHATDLAFFLDQEGVAVRSGHHCAQPLHRELGIAGSLRASLYFYNSQQDVDDFIVKLDDTIDIFNKIKS